MCRLCDNLCAAKELDIPICQDTGMAVIFAKVGQDVRFVGGSFSSAVNAGVAKGYTEGYLRKSVVADPLRRVNTGDNTPAVLHIELVEGDKVELTVAPKGFGSENMSALKMFTPSASREDIIDYVVDVVRRAGSNPCPPMVIGVGIGGDFEQCALLAKRRSAALSASPTPMNTMHLWSLTYSKSERSRNRSAGIRRKDHGSQRRRRICAHAYSRTSRSRQYRLSRDPPCDRYCLISCFIEEYCKFFRKAALCSLFF